MTLASDRLVADAYTWLDDRPDLVPEYKRPKLGPIDIMQNLQAHQMGLISRQVMQENLLGPYETEFQHG